MARGASRPRPRSGGCETFGVVWQWVLKIHLWDFQRFFGKRELMEFSNAHLRLRKSVVILSLLGVLALLLSPLLGGTIAAQATPVAVADTDTTAEDVPVTTNVLANDTGLADVPLTVTIAAAPANGTAVVNAANNTVTYTPNADFSGTDTYDYTVTDVDLENSTATVTVTVTAVNDAPAAADDPATTNEDTAVTIDVLANDTDVDVGDVLTVANLGTLTPPGNGTVVLNPDQTVTYTPDTGFLGVDTFTYTANDGQADSNVATVTVTVNAVPVASDATPTTDEDVSVGITLSGSDVETCELAFSIVSRPSNGTLSAITDAACTVGTPNTDSASVTYTPNPDFNGTDTFTYTVNDGFADSAPGTVTVTVNPVNDTPVANPDTDTTDDDVPVTTDVLANDTGLGDTPLTVTVTTAPANGTAVVNPDNTVTYTPNADFSGTDSYDYTVTDADLEASTATVNVTINAVNDAPVAADDAYSVDEDDALTVATVDGVLANDTDVEGDTITAVLVSDVSNGTLSLASDGSFTYTPDADFNGTDSFTYTANDATDASEPAPVTITVNPQPDILISPATGPVGTTVSFTANDFGADEPNIAVTFDGADVVTGVTAGSDGSWGPVTFDVPATPSGAYTVDASGATTAATDVPDQIFTVTPGLHVSYDVGLPGELLTAGGDGFDSGETLISVTYDGVVVAAGITADVDGRWSVTFGIPDNEATQGVVHIVDASGAKSAGADVPDRILYSSIQAAIDGLTEATPGPLSHDVDPTDILVGPGTYNEALLIITTLTVHSVNGAAATTIDACGIASEAVIIFGAADVTLGAPGGGFTIRAAPGFTGVVADSASRVALVDNVVEVAVGCVGPLAEGSAAQQVFGEGIIVVSSPGAQIIGNQVNVLDVDSGLGILLVLSPSSLIQSNTVTVVGGDGDNVGIVIDESSGTVADGNTVEVVAYVVGPPPTGSGLVNASFESWDLSGWAPSIPPGGSATVVTSAFGNAPIDGSFFALLKTDGPSSFTTISQSFSAVAGDTLSGFAFFFDAEGGSCFLNDQAQVRILSGTSTVVAIPFSASSCSTGTTPWTFWQFMVTTEGSYTVEARVANAVDSSVDSRLGLDALMPAAAPPQAVGGIRVLTSSGVLLQGNIIDALSSGTANIADFGIEVDNSLLPAPLTHLPDFQPDVQIVGNSIAATAEGTWTTSAQSAGARGIVLQGAPNTLVADNTIDVLGVGERIVSVTELVPTVVRAFGIQGFGVPQVHIVSNSTSVVANGVVTEAGNGTASAPVNAMAFGYKLGGATKGLIQGQTDPLGFDLFVKADLVGENTGNAFAQGMDVSVNGKLFSVLGNHVRAESDNSAEGMVVSNGEMTTISGNQVSVDAKGVQASGLELNSSLSSVVDNNLFDVTSNNGGFGIGVGGSDDSSLTGNTVNYTVGGPLVSEAFSDGIIVVSSPNIGITGNTVTVNGNVSSVVVDGFDGAGFIHKFPERNASLQKMLIKVLDESAAGVRGNAAPLQFGAAFSIGSGIFVFGSSGAVIQSNPVTVNMTSDVNVDLQQPDPVFGFGDVFTLALGIEADFSSDVLIADNTVNTSADAMALVQVVGLADPELEAVASGFGAAIAVDILAFGSSGAQVLENNITGSDEVSLLVTATGGAPPPAPTFAGAPGYLEHVVTIAENRDRTLSLAGDQVQPQFDDFSALFGFSQGIGILLVDSFDSDVLNNSLFHSSGIGGFSLAEDLSVQPPSDSISLGEGVSFTAGILLDSSSLSQVEGNNVTISDQAQIQAVALGVTPAPEEDPIAFGLAGSFAEGILLFGSGGSGVLNNVVDVGAAALGAAEAFEELVPEDAAAVQASFAFASGVLLDSSSNSKVEVNDVTAEALSSGEAFATQCVAPCAAEAFAEGFAESFAPGIAVLLSNGSSIVDNTVAATSSALALGEATSPDQAGVGVEANSFTIGIWVAFREGHNILGNTVRTSTGATEVVGLESTPGFTFETGIETDFVFDSLIANNDVQPLAPAPAAQGEQPTAGQVPPAFPEGSMGILLFVTFDTSVEGNTVVSHDTGIHMVDSLFNGAATNTLTDNRVGASAWFSSFNHVNLNDITGSLEWGVLNLTPPELFVDAADLPDLAVLAPELPPEILALVSDNVDALFHLTPLDATFNWFGDPLGPSGEGTGAGDAVSTGVFFDPWSTRLSAIVVGDQVCYCGMERPTDLQLGWNAFSTPVSLEANTLGDIISDFSKVQQAFAFNAATQVWQLVGPTSVLLSGQGVLVKVSEPVTVRYLFNPAISGPVSQNLSEEWNLVGTTPPLVEGEFFEFPFEGIGGTVDLTSSPPEHHGRAFFFPGMPLPEVLATIDVAGSTSQPGWTMVVSPPLNPDPFVFTVNSTALAPEMFPFRVYWIHMENPDELGGFTSTPMPLPQWLP